MRSREQFKAYVYEKADAALSARKKSRNIWLRTVATCSLLLIIGGVAIYGNLGGEKLTNESAPDVALEMYGAKMDDAGEIEAESYNCSAETKGNLYYSVADSALLDSVSGNGTVESFDFSKEKVTAALSSAPAHSEIKAASGSEDADDVSDINVIELAKKACTVEYDTYSLAYDKESDVWRVIFYKEATAGGEQTVYIDGCGNIRMIEYGE